VGYDDEEEESSSRKPRPRNLDEDDVVDEAMDDTLDFELALEDESIKKFSPRNFGKDDELDFLLPVLDLLGDCEDLEDDLEDDDPLAFFVLLDLLLLDLLLLLLLLVLLLLVLLDLGVKGEMGDDDDEKVSDENEDDASVRAVCPDSGENDLGVPSFCEEIVLCCSVVFGVVVGVVLLLVVLLILLV